jgi:hypothetical protein
MNPAGVGLPNPNTGVQIGGSTTLLKGESMAEIRTTDIVTRDDVRELLADRDGPTVSLYQPIRRGGAETENVVRYKNLVSAAEDRLEELGHRGLKVTGQMRLLLERGDFWRGQLNGLALFASPSYMRAFKLPVAFEELVVVGDSPHVTQLISALADEPLYVLAISQGSVRLVRGTRYGAKDVDLSDLGIPMSLDEAMRYDDFEKTNLERHPTQRRADTGGRTLQHGHGPGDADLKNEILRYFQAVDGGIRKILVAEHAPLILAAVDYLMPMYRQANSYAHLLDKGIEGNPEQLSAAQLAERARVIAEPHFRSGVARAAERFGNAIGSGLASCDLAEVLGGAFGGRVESLLVCKGERRWGIYDPGANDVEVHEQPEGPDVDLVDLAVRQSVLRGGRVFVVTRDDMPCDDAIAALFRY